MGCLGGLDVCWVEGLISASSGECVDMDVGGKVKVKVSVSVSVSGS
jgi:hypothetical protein